VLEFVASPWIPYSLLVLVTLSARWRGRSWFAPAAFVGLVWTFFIGGSLLVVDYPIPGRGMWMLSVLVISVQLGALMARELYPIQPPGVLHQSTNLAFLIGPCRRYGVLCTSVALLGCLYFLYSSLQEFDLPFTWLGVLAVGAQWTDLRINDGLEPWSVRVLVTWLHPAALLGGILVASSRQRRDRVIGAISLLPSFAYGFLTGARAAILLGATCWIGGYVATCCVRSQDQLAIFTGKRLALLLLTAIAMLGMFGSVDAIRNSTWNGAFVFDIEGQKLGNYILGPPAAFSSWYAHFDSSPPVLGARTFAGEFDLLHLKSRTVGTYLDKSNVIGTESTNVYTLFRGLIEDYTEFGAAFAAVFVGFQGGWIYCARHKNVRRSIFWLSMFFAIFLFSPLVSLFSFNGAALAWVVAGLVLTRKTLSSSPASYPTPE
jgi:oligosaccharide repeat unit polymerase